MNCDCKSELNEGRYRRCLDYKEAVIDNKCVGKFSTSCCSYDIYLFVESFLKFLNC